MAQETVPRLSEGLKTVLEWSKSHPGSTLQELEEQGETEACRVGYLAGYGEVEKFRQMMGGYEYQR